jgi:spore coat polysaccharide biosynthesis protein SpsF
MKTILIIQARMGSSRLPGKILKPLGNTVVLDYVVSRCEAIDGVDEVIVATSTLPVDDKVETWCKSHGVSCFRGSEEDVLARYYECAKPYAPDYVIRVTSDCPFVDYDLASRIIEKMRQNPADILLVQGELPRGLVVEMVSFQALSYIHEHGHEPRHREHVTYYAYEYIDEFRTITLEAPKVLLHSELRITLDTEEDYALLQKVADRFQKEGKLVPTQEVLNYLVAHPEVAALNAFVKQKPVL